MCTNCMLRDGQFCVPPNWFKTRLCGMMFLTALLLLYCCVCVLSDDGSNRRQFQRHITSANATTTTITDRDGMNRRLFKLLKRRRLRAVNFMQKKKRKSRVPEALLQQVLKLNKEQEVKMNNVREVKKKLIVRAKKGYDSPSCRNCFRFFREIPTIYTVLKKADLWLYVKAKSKTQRSPKKHPSIVVYKINNKINKDGGNKNDDNKYNEESILGRIKIRRNTQKWHNIVLKTIRDLIKISPRGGMNLDLTIRLECVHCDFQVYNDDSVAFLGLTAEGTITPPPATQRCRPGQLTCCLDDLQINLADYLQPKVGNIILPNKINIGMCRGHCQDIHAGVGPHSAMVNAVKLGKRDVRKDLCCVPKRYKSFSAIIDDGNNHFIVKVIHDLVVSECTCA